MLDELRNASATAIAKRIDMQVFYSMYRGVFRIYQQQLKSWWFITPARRRMINDAMGFADEYMEENYKRYCQAIVGPYSPDSLSVSETKGSE